MQDDVSDSQNGAMWLMSCLVFLDSATRSAGCSILCSSSVVEWCWPCASVFLVGLLLVKVSKVAFWDLEVHDFASANLRPLLKSGSGRKDCNGRLALQVLSSSVFVFVAGFCK